MTDAPYRIGIFLKDPRAAIPTWDLRDADIAVVGNRVIKDRWALARTIDDDELAALKAQTETVQTTVREWKEYAVSRK